MKTKKVVQIVVFIIFIIIAGLVYFNNKREVNSVTDYISPEQMKTLTAENALAKEVEIFLDKQMVVQDPMWNKTKDKACSFDLFGQDDKYIYGFGMCQELLRGDDGELFIANILADPLRISHSIPSGIISYERPTEECGGCGGTKPEDILPTKYYQLYLNFPYSILSAGNLEKLLADKPLTKDVALLLAKEDMVNNPADPFRSIGTPNGEFDSVGDEKNGWDFVFYINYSGPDGNRSNIAAICRNVSTYKTVGQTGVYNPSKGIVVQNINPKTCLPK